MFWLRAKVLVLVPLSLLALSATARELHGPYREVASTNQQLRPKGAHLTLGTALRIAEEEARRNEVTFSDFEAPWFWYRYEKGAGYNWIFFYDGKVPAPGNQFMVVVNDRTQHAEFVPGE